MPIRQELEIEDDPTLRRERRAGMFGHMEVGFAAINNLRIIAGGF